MKKSEKRFQIILKLFCQNHKAKEKLLQYFLHMRITMRKNKLHFFKDKKTFIELFK